GVFLRLYPREYRDLFGPEVLNVFAQAADEQRARGWSTWAWFMASELSGALVSAGGHWIDRFSPRRATRSFPADPEVAGARRTGLFSALDEAQNRIDLNLKRMEHAIAQRDFAAARAYSIEDLRAREELRKLRDRYGFGDDEMAVQ
ncbi:MAG TPA: hypothetical protein VN792_01215, partial [Candidatus Acidoferrales bacterium]|nr:hypothetical protein [Candidatus Acidoferrales bacterium]